MEIINPFIYDRPLNPIKDKDISIIREAKINEVILGLERGDYFALLAPNHTGKTTFIYQLTERIKQQLPNYRSIYINFEGIQHYNSEVFFQHLAQYIILRFRKEEWGGISGGTHIKNAGNFRHFLEIIASKIDFNLIFFLDGIEILSKEIAKELLFILKTIYIESTINQKFKKTTVLISGTVDLLELTVGEDAMTSPFNISEQITLSDFQEKEVLIFIQKLNDIGIKINKDCINKLYELTKGQPYLVQKICYMVVETAKEKLKNEKKEITMEEFNECIEQISEAEDEAFAYLTLKLEQELEDDVELLKILESLLYSKEDTYIVGKWDTSFKKLELAGVIAKEGNKIRIRTPLYEKVLKRHFTKAYFARIYFAKEKWGEATRDFKEHNISQKELKAVAEISHKQVGLITKTTTSMLKKLPLDKILDMILESIVQCLGFERSYLYLIDRKEEKLICNQIVDSKNQIDKDTLYHIYLKGDTKSHLATVILEQEEYLSPEIATQAKNDTYLRQHFGEKGSVLAIPLINEDKSMGILGVYNTNPIKEADRNLISFFANQIALIIKNDTICKRLRILNEISGLIASNTEISIILNLIIKKILEGLDFAEIGLFEFKDNVLKLKDNMDWSQKNEYKLGEGIIGTVAKNGKPNKISTTSQMSMTNEEVLAVPLKLETQVIGVLAVRSVLPNSFNTDDMEFLSTCAEQIVMAIDNAKHFEEIEQRFNK
ncbi:MAG: GAF domain-containing protein [Nitrospirota bacterium]